MFILVMHNKEDVSYISHGDSEGINRLADILRQNTTKVYSIHEVQDDEVENLANNSEELFKRFGDNK